MPLTCSVCGHPDVAEVERMLADGAPRRAVARQFGLSRDAVGRHVRADHGGSASVVPIAARGSLLAPDLAVRGHALLAAADAAVREAERSGGSMQHLRALRGFRSTLRATIWTGPVSYRNAQPISEVEKAALERSWRRAVAAYDATEDRAGPRLTALEGLREALAALWKASPPPGGGWMQFVVTIGGQVIGESPPFWASKHLLARAGETLHLELPRSASHHTVESVYPPEP